MYDNIIHTSRVSPFYKQCSILSQLVIIVLHCGINNFGTLLNFVHMGIQGEFPWDQKAF